MPSPVIETRDLTKVYGKDFVAVDHLNLRIEEGEVYGFLGPNGAGKTTTILMLLGLTEPTSGGATVLGHNPTRQPLSVKRFTGYLPEKIGFYEDLTARQNLEYTARLNDMPASETEARMTQLLKRVGLAEVVDKPVGQMSRGMKQRLGIADVLMKKPKLIFLDEPTASIDPKGTHEVLDFIADTARQGITVVLSSHQLHQVQHICNRVGIMSQGKLVAEGPVDRLGREVAGRFRIKVKVAGAAPALIANLKKLNKVVDVTRDGDQFYVDCDEDVSPQVAKTIVDSGSLLVEMKIQAYTLEEIYRKYFERS